MSDPLREGLDRVAEVVNRQPGQEREAAIGEAEGTPWNRSKQLEGLHGHYQAGALAARVARLAYLDGRSLDQPATGIARNEQVEEVIAGLEGERVDLQESEAVRQIVENTPPTKSSQATAHMAVTIVSHAPDLAAALEMADKIETAGEVPHLNGPLLREHLRKVYGSAPPWQRAVAGAATRRLREGR